MQHGPPPPHSFRPGVPHARRSLLLVAVLTLLAAGAKAGSAPSTPAPWTRADTQSASLADAAERLDRAGTRARLKAGARPDEPQPDGMTALHWAAQKEDVELARILLRAGARADVTNRYGVRPLSLACRSGNGELVRLLLEAGADANTPLPGGETPLMTAARTGKPGPVQALLAGGARVNAQERRGQTALMWAAAEGHQEVVQALLRAGADLQVALEESGYTALFFAAREGRTGAARALLKAGADINQELRPGRVWGKGPRKGTSPLLLAVENGHFELAVALLDAGADPNDQRSGFTPLHVLTWVRKPNRGDGDDGDPAPIGSGNMSSLQFVRKLAEHGADANARLTVGASGRGLMTRRGATPFLLAAGTADAAYMKLLVELGADPGLGNAEHCTPLMAAAGVGTLAPTEEAGTEPEVLEAVQLALDLGNDLNAVDDNGETAMHGAAYKNLPEVVRWLARKGARIEVWNRPNNYGWTPVRIAEGYRVGNFKPSPETVAALQEAFRAAGLTPPAPTPPGAGADREPYPAAEGKKKP